jgi:hypothetical protein
MLNTGIALFCAAVPRDYRLQRPLISKLRKSAIGYKIVQITNCVLPSARDIGTQEPVEKCGVFTKITGCQMTHILVCLRV